MPLVFKLKIFQTRGAAPFWRARKVGGLAEGSKGGMRSKYQKQFPNSGEI